MTFLVLLLVLAVRRLELAWPSWMVGQSRHQRGLQWLAGRFGDSPLVWWVGVLLPALLVLLLACVDGWLGTLLSLFVGVPLLLWLLGPQSEFRQVDELLVRGRMNDQQGFAALAEDAFAISGSPAQADYQRQLMGEVLSRELQVFVAIFWLVIFGFAGATLYLLNRAWLVRNPQASGFAASLDQLLLWLPQRLLLLCMALAGTFTGVMETMAGHWWQRESSATLLHEVVYVALAYEADFVVGDLSSATDQLEALQGLLLRCLAMWLILAALWVLLW